MKWDAGDFTLAQLVGLVTHETLNDDDAVKVLLLCHRCFSDSMELMEAVRKRFFVPAPEEPTDWSEVESHFCVLLFVLALCLQFVC